MADAVTTSVTWQLPEGKQDPQVDNALSTYFVCIMGNVARLVTSPLDDEAVLDRAIAACTVEEAGVLDALARASPESGRPELTRLRQDLRPHLLEAVKAVRKPGGK